jgi:hypothetical protein
VSTQPLGVAINHTVGQCFAKTIELSNANPEVYMPEVAVTLNHLGTLYKFDGKPAIATPFCVEASSIYKKLAIENPDKFGPALSQVCAVD